MTESYFSLGNDVVNLIGILNPSGEITSFAPMVGNVNGAIFAVTEYPIVDDLSERNVPTVGLVNGDMFNVPLAYGLVTASVNYAYAGDTEGSLERQNNNIEKEAFPLATRSSSVISDDLLNTNSKGGHFIIYVDDIEIDAVIIPSIEGYDDISGEYYTILTGLAINETGVYTLKVYPGISQIPNGSASDILPRIFRISVPYSGTGNIDYSIGINLVL